MIHHSGQGSQYTYLAFGKRCKGAGVRPSMGSVGNASDNAMGESFLVTLECELLDRRRFTSQAETRMACFSFIAYFTPSWARISGDRGQGFHDIAGTRFDGVMEPRPIV